MTQYMATCVPGAEEIVKDELGTLIAEGNTLSTERGKVFFSSANELQHLLQTRCADNLYRVLGRFSIGPHKEDLPAFRRAVQRVDYGFLAELKSRRIVVSASRAGRHSYSRFDLSNAATEALLALGTFTPGDEKAHDLAFRVDVKDDGCLFTLQLTKPDFRFRSDAFASVRGGIRPTVAQCLVRVSQPRGNETFYDPFCGAGTIAFERAAHPHRKLFASDIDAAVLEAARANLASDVILFQADATKTQMKNESVDTVVSNIPWGKQVAVEDLGQLYADFLRELRRILKPDGKAVLFTDQQEPLEGACRGAGFTCVQVTQFSLHGLHPGVFIIRRAEP